MLVKGAKTVNRILTVYLTKLPFPNHEYIKILPKSAGTNVKLETASKRQWDLLFFYLITGHLNVRFFNSTFIAYCRMFSMAL